MPWINFIAVSFTLFICHTVVVAGSPSPDKAVSIPLWRYENAEASELNDLIIEFSDIEKISLKQSWLSVPEPGLNPTDVKVVWNSESLYIFARLQDEDIGSSSTHFNQRLWELGDAFEVFIHLKESDVYYEFHVSPNNHVMQLRFDVSLTPAQRRLQLPDLFMPRQVVQSKVWVEASKNQWHALLIIPASVLTSSCIFAADDTLNFSFSRYDYSHVSEEVILSSSSDLNELDFHRREDWGTFRLDGRVPRDR